MSSRISTRLLALIAAGALPGTALAQAPADVAGTVDVVTGTDDAQLWFGFNDGVDANGVESWTGSPTLVYGANGAIFDTARADMDGDGWEDVLTTSSGSQSVTVCFNTGGDPNPTSPLDCARDVFYDVNGASIGEGWGSAFGVNVGDFNDDGLPDLTSGDVLCISEGDRTFTCEDFRTEPLQVRPSDAGDLDGDGTDDLFIIERSGAGTIQSCLNQGDIDSDGLPELSCGPTGIANDSSFGSPYDLELGDFTGDGVLDVIVRTNSGGYGCVGNGDGTFDPNCAGGPSWGNFIDWDGDGVLEYLKSRNGGPPELLSWNAATSSFDGAVISGCGANWHYLVKPDVRDIDSDGQMEFISRSSTQGMLAVNALGFDTDGVTPLCSIEDNRLTYVYAEKPLFVNLDEPLAPPGGGGYTPDGICDADDEVVNNTNGLPDDCDQDDDGVHIDDDCDDTDAATGTAGTWYTDADGDGLGDPATAVSACTQPPGLVDNGDDVVGDDDADNDGTSDANDVCEGIADTDLDGDGITDCLEETLTLTADRSHVRWFNTRTGKAKVNGQRVTFDKNKSWANFTGQMALGGGLLAPDFRDAADNGNGQVSVSIGGVEVYDETIQYDVYDACNASTSDNREKWQHRDVYVNAYGKKPYAVERAVLRFRNSMRYRSWQEAGYPAMSTQDNLGRVHSRFISADESRIRVRWNRKTELPLTVSLNGVDLVTITDNGDNTYTVDGGDYPVETVFRGNGDLRKRVIDVIYPDNLQEGDEVTWTDGTGLELHAQTLQESAASTSNTDSHWYNAGGRFHLRVPFGDDVIAGTVDEATSALNASVTIQIGDANSAGVVEGTTDYTYDVVTPGHWRVAEVDEDSTGTGGGGGGQGGSQGGSTCQTNDSDDPEPN